MLLPLTVLVSVTPTTGLSGSKWIVIAAFQKTVLETDGSGASLQDCVSTSLQSAHASRRCKDEWLLEFQVTWNVNQVSHRQKHSFLESYVKTGNHLSSNQWNEKTHFWHYFPRRGCFLNDKTCVMAAVLVCRCVHVHTYLSMEETDPFLLFLTHA